MAKSGEKIKVPIFIRRKGADAFRPALAAGGSLMAYKCLSLCDFFIVQQFFKLCHICLMLFENLRGLHFHIGIIRHLREILHQEINILLDSPDGSFQCRIVDSVDSFLRSRAVLRVQNLVHDLLAVRKIGSGKAVHISITNFELPGQDFLLHTGHHLFHDLYAAHEFFRTGNVGFADIVPLRNLLADARFRRGGRNCVNLTQFLRCAFLGSSCVLVVAVSTGLSMFHTVLFSNEELLLLRREIAPPQLVLANPSEDFFPVFKRERHGGEINLRVLLEDGITIVTVNEGVVSYNQRGEQLAFLEDIFFKLLKFIIGQRGNLGLKLWVDFQIDHMRTPLSLLLRRFFLPEKGRNILLCGFQLEQFGLGFLVLLVELCLFGCQLRILGFQFLRAGQLCDAVCLEISCCRPVPCQLCMVLLLKGYGAIFLVFL